MPETKLLPDIWTSNPHKFRSMSREPEAQCTGATGKGANSEWICEMQHDGSLMSELVRSAMGASKALTFDSGAAIVFGPALILASALLAQNFGHYLQRQFRFRPPSRLSTK
jgi:hypothetical protein